MSRLDFLRDYAQWNRNRAFAVESAYSLAFVFTLNRFQFIPRYLACSSSAHPSADQHCFYGQQDKCTLSLSFIDLFVVNWVLQTWSLSRASATVESRDQGCKSEKCRLRRYDFERRKLQGERRRKQEGENEIKICWFWELQIGC